MKRVNRFISLVFLVTEPNAVLCLVDLERKLYPIPLSELTSSTKQNRKYILNYATDFDFANGFYF